MATKAAVDSFLAQPSIAVVGVSRNPNKFGTMAYRELRKKGMKVIPVNDKTDKIEGDPCYPNLEAIPEKVGGVLVIVPPPQAEKVVQQAFTAGIKNIWLQQGSESPAALHFCQENNLNVVSGECILMFAKPQFPHTAHRWIWGILGKLPK